MAVSTQDGNDQNVVINSSKLTQAIADYERAIADMEVLKSKPPLAQVLELLQTRDRVEELRQTETVPSSQTLAELISLDRRLLALAEAIACDDQLIDCRKSLQPPETAWWWFLPPPKEPIPKSDKFDWVWNGLTVACLLFATTFATNTFKAFSQNGMNLLQTFGTISQSAGLVLVSGGALTDKGQKAVKDILASFKIPPAYYAETTFAFSALVLLGTYGINQSLVPLGEFYYKQGNNFYNQGELSQAQKRYEEALSLNPDNANISVALGNIYATVEEYDQAKAQYKLGLNQGDPASLNGLGRVILRTATSNSELFQAEAVFRLALSEKYVQDILKSELHTNLAWTLLQQAEENTQSATEIQALQAEAEQNLKIAIALEEKAKEKVPGFGMSHCYLATLWEQNGNQAGAVQQWKLCQERAFPTSMSQYKEILKYGGSEIITKVDTTGIVSEDPKLFDDK